MGETLARREFIGLPAQKVLRPAALEPPSAYHASTMDYANPVQVWATDAKHKIARLQDVSWTATRSGDPAITLRPEVRYQEMLGFGAALTGATCYVLSNLPQDARSRLFHTLFHPSELGMNVCRTCIGSSDCSVSIYSYDDGEVDPDLSRFSIEKDREYILPILREARAINPELFLFASPWSPPGWMKSNGSMLGGCMRHTYMPSYANYFLRYLREYEAAGVSIQAVTIQNEVDGDQDGSMPACAWPQDYEADFLTMHLGPLFQRAGISTKIWIIDHNYNLWGRAICELETPDVLKFTNGVAWHGYAGEPEWILRVQQAFPGVEMYWTEGDADFHAPDYATEWSDWGETFTRIFRSGCKSATVWTLASDERGRPDVGSGDGLTGAMLVNSKTQQITYSGMFWALAQFSKFVRRGATRIESEGPSDKLFHCAFENPDGSLVSIVTNQGPERACALVVGEKSVRLLLSADSVTTLVTGTPIRP